MVEEFSLKILLDHLSATSDPIKQSAIIAEVAIDRLPPIFAQVARRCIILRWFDVTLIQAFLPKDTAQSEAMALADHVYKTLISLPFIEKLEWGLAYHAQTRKGLLYYYEVTQPEMLKETAALAAPVYLQHNNKTLAEVEALFCYIVAGKQGEAGALLDQLLLQAGSLKELYTIVALFQTQEQAESLRFVTKIELSPLQGAIRDLALLAPSPTFTPVKRSQLSDIVQSYTRSFSHLDQEELADTVKNYISSFLHYNQEESKTNIGSSSVTLIMTEAEFPNLLMIFAQSPEKVSEILPHITDFDALFYAARRFISSHPFEEAKLATEFAQAVATQTSLAEHQAFVHWCQGILYANRQPQQALEHAVQALRYFQSTSQTEYEGRLLIGYAHQLNLMGDLMMAKEASLQAIERLAHLPDYPDWPAVYINLANTLILLGDYPTAIGYAQKADTEAQRLSQLMPDTELAIYQAMRSLALNNQALALLLLGRLPEAEAKLQQALAQALLADSPEDAGRAELNLVRIATEKGELFAALKRLHQATRYFEAAQVELELATAAIEEAILYEKLAMTDRAIDAATRAALAFAKAGIPAESVEARLIGVQLALRVGEKTNAIAQLAAAAQQLTKAPLLHQARWQGYRAHPQLYKSLAEKEQALSMARSAQQQLAALNAQHETLEVALIVAALSRDLKRSDAKEQFMQIADLAQQYGLPLIEQQACVQLAELQPNRLAVSTWQRAARLATNLRTQMPVEELKARLLTGQADVYAQLLEAQLQTRQPHAAVASLLEAKGSIWLELTAPASPVTPSADRLNAKINLDFWRKEQQSALTAQHQEACARKITEAENALVEATRRQERLRQPLPMPTLAEIQARLPDAGYLLEYLVGKTHIWCCQIRADGDIQWQQLCKRTDVETALDQLHGLIRTLQFCPPEERRRRAQGNQRHTINLLQKLYHHLLAPLPKAWAEAGLMIIAPDRQLYDVPWTALHDGVAFLSERQVISLTPSAVLVTKRTDTPLMTAISTTPPQLLGYARSNRPLQFLDAELQAVKNAFSNAVLHKPASSHDLQALIAPSLLHIAAHGDSRAANPLLSALDLADGEFYLADILNLSLHGTQLVTLSACETGKTPATGGAILALAGAFLCAGAQQTLSTLWSVDDEATQLLMAHFYQQLCTGSRTAQALQFAQLETRRAGYTHPFYWAAIQPLGQGQ